MSEMEKTFQKNQIKKILKKNRKTMSKCRMSRKKSLARNGNLVHTKNQV